VAALKGVLLSACPGARIVDAAHDIAPQDVRAAAWVLCQYWSYYPAGSIHVAVVDPGVGSARNVVLADVDGHRFLVPDNGLLTWVLHGASRFRCWKLRDDVQRPGVRSSTFHGRDIFAYAAGRLAAGAVVPGEMADPVDDVEQADWPLTQQSGNRVSGRVIHADRFGNLITNIARSRLEELGWDRPRVRAGEWTAEAWVTHYAEAPGHTLVAVWGSSGMLELSWKEGSARQQTGVEPGAPVVVEWVPL
jgi:S-adenosylmethionine hydrolase